MTVKKGYNRFFIIFQEEDKGFGIAIDKQPTGYTKIESRNGKCKITVYVQNLIKEKGPYICCLLDSTKNPVVYARMGEINVDEAGRGETWWEYREEDIADTGIPSDRFNTAAVIIESQDILAPLVGYVGKDRLSWKDRLPINDKRSVQVEEKAEEKTEEKIENEVKEIKEEVEEEVEEEGRKFEEYEQRLQEQEAALPDKEETSEAVEKPENRIVEDSHEIVRQEPIHEDIIEEIKAEVLQEVPQEAAQEVNQEIPEETEEIVGSEGLNRIIDMDIPEEEDERHKKKKTHTSIFLKILDNYEEIKDISPEMKSCRWWKVPYTDNMQIKDNKDYQYYCAVHHLKMTYPYLNYIKYFKKCGYSYFGIKFGKDGELKYIMYGIEGVKNRDDQPYMGMTGFVKWVPVSHKNTGMWVMYYNPYTGCIMIPKKEHKMSEYNE